MSVRWSRHKTKRWKYDAKEVKSKEDQHHLGCPSTLSPCSCRWRTDHLQALWKGISHTLSDINSSDCSFFKELQRTPPAARHYRVCFGRDSLRAFISLLAHASARHETISLEDHPPVPWWEAELWLHFLRIKEPSFTFEMREEKNTIISLSAMFQSIHPLTITAKMSFDRNSLQR